LQHGGRSPPQVTAVVGDHCRSVVSSSPPQFCSASSVNTFLCPNNTKNYKTKYFCVFTVYCIDMKGAPLVAS
jgi:hypothetical protein